MLPRAFRGGSMRKQMAAFRKCFQIGQQPEFTMTTNCVITPQ